MLNLIKAALVFLGILSLSTSNSFALAPEWKVYRDVFEKGDCARIIRELGAIQQAVPEPHGDFWSKSMMFLGKCLLKENQPEKAKKFILLAAKGVHSDVALFHLIQANIKSGEKSQALENISQLLQQPKHVFYLARIRNLLRENFNSEDERKMLFHFLSQHREHPEFFLHDAKLHQLFITQSDLFKQPVNKKLRLLGWQYPEDEKTANKKKNTDFLEKSRLYLVGV